MDKKKLEAFAREVAKGLKTEKDLNEFSQILTKITVEAALNAELGEHLGYEQHAQRGVWFPVLKGQIADRVQARGKVRL